MARAKMTKVMKVITINIPILYHNHIKKLLKMGIIPSVSEYVRWSIGNQINRDLEKLVKINEVEEYDVTKFVRIPNRQHGEELVKIVRRLEY